MVALNTENGNGMKEDKFKAVMEGIFGIVDAGHHFLKSLKWWDAPKLDEVLTTQMKKSILGFFIISRATGELIHQIVDDRKNGKNDEMEVNENMLVLLLPQCVEVGMTLYLDSRPDNTENDAFWALLATSPEHKTLAIIARDGLNEKIEALGKVLKMKEDKPV